MVDSLSIFGRLSRHGSINSSGTLLVPDSFSWVDTIQNNDSLPKRVTIGMLDSFFVIVTILYG